MNEVGWRYLIIPLQPLRNLSVNSTYPHGIPQCNQDVIPRKISCCSAFHLRESNLFVNVSLLQRFFGISAGRKSHLRCWRGTVRIFGDGLFSKSIKVVGWIKMVPRSRIEKIGIFEGTAGCTGSSDQGRQRRFLGDQSKKRRIL